MEAKGKILFIIGGVTPKNYALEQLLSHRWVRNKGYALAVKDGNPSKFIALGSEISNYYAIEEIDCEQFFDSKALTFFEKLFLFAIPARLWDRIGDYYKALRDTERLEKISACITQKIKEVQELGYQVDVIGHSLGSLLALGADVDIENLYFLGSPLTSENWLIRSTANKHASIHALLNANKIYYSWSPKDFICTKPIDDPGVINVPESLPSSGYAASHALSDHLTECFNRGYLRC